MAVVEIRDAEEEYLPDILRVLRESGIDGGRSFTLGEARDQLASLRETPGYRLLVAIVDGELAGTYALYIHGKLGKRGAPAGMPLLMSRWPSMPATQPDVWSSTMPARSAA